MGMEQLFFTSTSTSTNSSLVSVFKNTSASSTSTYTAGLDGKYLSQLAQINHEEKKLVENKNEVTLALYELKVS